MTEEREGEGERPHSQVLENAQMRTRRSIDASVLALKQDKIVWIKDLAVSSKADTGE